MSATVRWRAPVADALLAVGQDLEARRGHMFGHPALYAGRMLAACAYGDGLGLKLPAERVAALIARGRAAPSPASACTLQSGLNRALRC